MSVALSPLVSEFETEEQGTSYTAWLKAKIQASLNDPHPNIPHDQVLSEIAVARLCRSGHHPRMGTRLHRVAQQRSSPQPHPLRHPGTTALWRRQSDTGEASAVYENAKVKRPERWSGDTRDWTPVGSVMLNPERPVPDLQKAA